MREEGISLSEMDFDEKRNINKRKKLIAKGIDPDEYELMKKSLKKEKMKQIKKEKRRLGRQKRAKEKELIDTSIKTKKKPEVKVKKVMNLKK